MKAHGRRFQEHIVLKTAIACLAAAACTLVWGCGEAGDIDRASQVNRSEPRIQTRVTPAAASSEDRRAALFGTWAPQDIGCASGAFVTLASNGRFTTFDSKGEWTLLDDNIRFTTMEEGAPPDPMATLSPPTVSLVRVSMLTRDKLRWQPPRAPAQTMLRCPAV